MALVIGVAVARTSHGAVLLTDLAAIATPVLAALAGVARRWRRAWLPLLVVPPLYGIAWMWPGSLLGDAAGVALIAGACLAVTGVVAGLAPPRWTAVGLVLLVVLDCLLVWGDRQVGPATIALQSATPLSLFGHPLPSLQQAQFGSMQLGWLDLAAPALLGLIVRRRVAACLATAVGAGLWDLLFFVTPTIAATPPVLAGLAAGRVERRRMGRRAPAAGAVVIFLVALAGIALPPPSSLNARATRLPLAGKVVAIDPGHNPNNWKHVDEIDKPVPAGGFLKACDTTGTESADGYTEAAFNFDVATRLARALKAAGATVVLTRTAHTPWGPCINQRAEIGNRAHAEAAISIHADGGPQGGRGFEVIYPPNTGITRRIATASKRLAVDVRNAYAAGTGMSPATYVGHDGLDVRRDLGGLNLSTVPKVFLEAGNMHNAADAALLENPAFRQRTAVALAHGLETFLLG